MLRGVQSKLLIGLIDLPSGRQINGLRAVRSPLRGASVWLLGSQQSAGIVRAFSGFAPPSGVKRDRMERVLQFQQQFG